MSEFEQWKDAGRLHASKSKRKETSPDYWGEICIDAKDLTNLTVTKEGWLVIPLSGWKKYSKANNQYLSLKVNRLVLEQMPEQQMGGKKQEDEMNDDIPF